MRVDPRPFLEPPAKRAPRISYTYTRCRLATVAVAAVLAVANAIRDTNDIRHTKFSAFLRIRPVAVADDDDDDDEDARP